MTLVYHGTPITPRRVLETLAGYSFCVSHAQTQDIERVHEIGQRVMLDNGAFSAWTRKAIPDWPRYYRWAERWLRHPKTWAVIPDLIDAGDTRHARYDENDALIEAWPHGDRGAPVWHMHESLDRLVRLASQWPRVCIGSSRQYATLNTARWQGRMNEAMNALWFDGPPNAEIHMLRGLQFAGGIWPFASVDSTNIARNHNRDQNTAAKMAAFWATQHCPTTWSRRPTQEEFHALHV